MDDQNRSEIQKIIIAEITRILISSRENANLTIDEAAEKIGIGTELLREYESAGKIHPLDFIKVLEAYGMDKISALDHLNGIGLKAWASKS